MIDTGDPIALTWNCVADMATRCGRVNVEVTTIADRTGLSGDAVEQSLDDLAVVGMVATWDAGEGRVATLSPYAAAKLGLKLDGAEGRGGLVWRRVGARDRKDRRRPKRVRLATSLDIDLDSLPGNAPRPEQEAEAAEMMESFIPRQGRRLSDAVRSGAKLPWPTLIITGHAAWGGEPDTGRCPTCEDAPIGTLSYCARCDRYPAVDWLLAKIRMEDRQAIKQAKQTTEPKPFAVRLHGASA